MPQSGRQCGSEVLGTRRLDSHGGIRMAAWPKYATLVALVALLVFLGVIYGYRWGLWDLGVVFSWLRRAPFALGAASLLAVAAAGALLFRRAFLAFAAALSVAVASGALGYLPLWMRSVGATVPPIHDITTDVQDPPEFVATRPLRADAPNPAEYDPGQTAQQLEAYPEIKPLVMPRPMPEAFEIALDAVEAEGLKIVAAAPAQGRIEAVETVPLFGFKDDVVIRLRNAHNVATVIDIRSKSRVGRSDLGFNARRVRSLLQRMDEAGGSLNRPVEGPASSRGGEQPA